MKPIRLPTLLWPLSLAALLLSGCASTVQAPIGSAVPAAAPTADALLPSAAPATEAAPSLPPAAAPAALLQDSLQPGVAINVDAPLAQADLWERLRGGFAMPDLRNELVEKAEQWYSSRPDYVQRMSSRGSRYLYHIVEEVEKRGMPSELALLPFIESAFNPVAMSSAKASGIWQFMPATGRDFDLRQNVFRDDRRDVLASTRAALDYLQQLHRMFGDWHLALAAYNWGQGNVQRAIKRNERAGLPTDYESLRMPAETRYYVPKLQAVKNIVLRPEAFALSLPAVANHPYFLTVTLERDIDVELAARLADMPLDEFKAFNPQANKPLLLGAADTQLLLPWDNAERFARNLQAHQGPLASWTAWVVPRTMKPADAAAKVGMSEAALREVNRIPPRMLVRQGSTLLVPRSGKLDHDVSEHLADTASLSLSPEGPRLRRLALKAGRADTVASIAKRYRVSAAQVAQWNKVSTSTRFKRGDRIVVYAPALNKAAPTRSAKAGSVRKTTAAARKPKR